MILKKQNGIAMAGAILAIGIFTVSLYFFMSSMATLTQTDEKNKERVAAEVYASELLEFFISHKPERLRQNLRTNPVNPTLGAYKFCAHINLLDRASGRLLNRDPLAEIPQPALLDADAAGNAVNRFYMVNIVDMETLQPLDICNSDFNDMAIVPSEHQRYMVTVGVTWKRQGSDTIEREVVTGIIPQS